MATSFATDIKLLFTAMDRDHMMGSFDLWDYNDVKANAAGIYSTVEDGSMPPSEQAASLAGPPTWSPGSNPGWMKAIRPERDIGPDSPSTAAH